jgi:hypothetical protein
MLRICYAHKRYQNFCEKLKTGWDRQVVQPKRRYGTRSRVGRIWVWIGMRV